MDWHYLSSVLRCVAKTGAGTFVNLIVLSVVASSQNQPESGSTDGGRSQLRFQGIVSPVEDRQYNSLSYVLAKMDLSLDQLNRKLSNTDNRLSRIENKLEHSDWAKDASMHLRSVEFPSYTDMQLSRISSRLDVLEREIREMRYGSRNTEEVGRSSCRGCTQLKDNTPIREMISQVVTDNTFRLEDSMKWQIREQSASLWERLDRSLGEMEENVFTQINDTLNGISLNCVHKANNPESAVGSEESDIHFLVQKAITQSETKFRKLDSDVEKYTRKVMGGIRDLWTLSDQVKVTLEEALRLGNQTREVVRYEFLKLHQQIEPLPRLEPKLAEISATLHRNLGDLGATVDRSFASLLIAQNTFIDNCRRLHDEETHAYDVLQAVVHEMRNRSVSDMGRISADIRIHGDKLGRTFEAVLDAVFAVGNNTVEQIGKLASRSCPQLRAQMANSEGIEMIREPTSPSRMGQKNAQDYDTDYPVAEADYVDV